MNIEQSDIPKINIRDPNKAIVHILDNFKICYIQFIYVMPKQLPCVVTLNGQMWRDHNILFHKETLMPEKKTHVSARVYWLYRVELEF